MSYIFIQAPWCLRGCITVLTRSNIFTYQMTSIFLQLGGRTQIKVLLFDPVYIEPTVEQWGFLRDSGSQQVDRCRKDVLQHYQSSGARDAIERLTVCALPLLNFAASIDLTFVDQRAHSSAPHLSDLTRWFRRFSSTLCATLIQSSLSPARETFAQDARGQLLIVYKH
jgi:hypothetical protein